MSATFGESLTSTGRSVSPRQRSTSARVSAASVPIEMHPLSTLGQETFSSIARTLAFAAMRATTTAYSCGDHPPTLTINGTPSSASRGRVWSQNLSTPGFARPIELIIPLGVSAIRGGGLPSRGLSVTVLLTNAPRPSVPAINASSVPEPLISGLSARYRRTRLRAWPPRSQARTRPASSTGPRRTAASVRRRCERHTRSRPRTHTPWAPPSPAGSRLRARRTCAPPRAASGQGRRRTRWPSGRARRPAARSPAWDPAPPSQPGRPGRRTPRVPRIGIPEPWSPSGQLPSRRRSHGSTAAPMPPPTRIAGPGAGSKPRPSGPSIETSPVAASAWVPAPRDVEQKGELVGVRPRR